MYFKILVFLSSGLTLLFADFNITIELEESILNLNTNIEVVDTNDSSTTSPSSFNIKDFDISELK